MSCKTGSGFMLNMFWRAQPFNTWLGLDDKLSIRLMLSAHRIAAHETSGKSHLGGGRLFIPEVPRLEAVICTGERVIIPVTIIRFPKNPSRTTRFLNSPFIMKTSKNWKSIIYGFIFEAGQLHELEGKDIARLIYSHGGDWHTPGCSG